MQMIKFNKVEKIKELIKLIDIDCKLAIQEVAAQEKVYREMRSLMI